MKILIKFSPEIIIKSRSVRLFFIKVLIKNIQIIFHKYEISASIMRRWDYLEIQYENHSYSQISKILINIPGIHHFLLVQDSIINTLKNIYYQITLINYQRKLSEKTFCIRVKRQGNHAFTSKEIECYLGNKLCRNINNAYVNLTKPDEIIYLEIKDNRLFIIIERIAGLGGLPIGTQRESISLISGGFDSAVSSYMLIRRGCKVHYCFFNLIGSTHNYMPIYDIVYYLWNQFSYSHKIKLIVIDFVEVVNEILSKIKNNFSGIILKRMMIRAATSIASLWNIKTLITGEVLGQVSSQTLDNLLLINNVTTSDFIIFRPLIAHDKESIIELARKIGTEKFSKKTPEYCGIISKKSVLKIKKKFLELEESYFNDLILKKAISNAHVINVCNIPQYIKNQHIFAIETQTKLYSTDIILDIRTEYEQENNPLKISQNIEIQKIPFYKLINQFPQLDQNKIYLLYCEHGIMSRLQALYLYEKGFHNVKIYRFSS